VIGAAGAALYAYALAKGVLSRSEVMFRILTTVAALGCGLMAGFFFSFSTVVMTALARQPPPAGMAAMQAINVAVFNPWFGLAFIGTPAACVLAMIGSLSKRHDRRAIHVLIGGAMYLTGTLLVTALFNVPRNDALEAVAPTAAAAVGLWSGYLQEWTNWNHVRTAAAVAGAATLTTALMKDDAGTKVE